MIIKIKMKIRIRIIKKIKVALRIKSMIKLIQMTNLIVQVKLIKKILLIKIRLIMNKFQDRVRKAFLQLSSRNVNTVMSHSKIKPCLVIILGLGIKVYFCVIFVRKVSKIVMIK